MIETYSSSASRTRLPIVKVWGERGVHRAKLDGTRVPGPDRLGLVALEPATGQDDHLGVGDRDDEGGHPEDAPS
jgi:hypothetical protein